MDPKNGSISGSKEPTTSVACWMGRSNSKTWMIMDLPGLKGLVFPKHISKVPKWVLDTKQLRELDLSFCELIERLPINGLIELGLTHLNLEGCKELWTPPKEVCNQGGRATMQFLNNCKREGRPSKDMALFLLGDGEAGKTSVARALIKGHTDRIRSDHRTIGIDVVKWETGWGTTLAIYDLAGQSIYAKTHQIFLLRRAIYLLVWRVIQPRDHSDEDFDTIRSTIKYWLDALQNRMPGSHLMIVVTHIDEVDNATLQDQCKFVKICVDEQLKEITQAGSTNIRILGGGESIPVNSLRGDGIPELRKNLESMVKSMPWYMELLPKSWIDLSAKVEERREERFLKWREYYQLAGNCKIVDEMVQCATVFFHETGRIRYFGDFEDEESAVYVSTIWMMDVMKGIIRHNRQQLIDYFKHKNNTEMLRRVHVLIVCGKLHSSILPYLWPESDESREYWSFEWQDSKKSTHEIDVWQKKGSSSAIISNSSDMGQIIGLLEHFDLLVEDTRARKGPEKIYFVPGVMPPGKVPIDKIQIDITECPNRVTYEYNSIPSGAVESIIVRLIKKHPKVQFTSYMAVIYDDDGEIAQIFAIDCRLVLRASSRALFKDVEKEVKRMHKFFPGLQHNVGDQKNGEVSSDQRSPFSWSGAIESPVAIGIECLECSGYVELKNRTWADVESAQTSCPKCMRLGLALAAWIRPKKKNC